MSVSHEQLRKAVTEAYPCDGLRCADGEYSLPDEDCIERLGRRLLRFHFDSGAKFADERLDCDNFARLAVALGKYDHGIHFLGNTGLAIAEAHVVTDTLLHVVLLAVHQVDEKLVVKFYETIPEGNQCLNPFSLPVRRLLFVSF